LIKDQTEKNKHFKLVADKIVLVSASLNNLNTNNFLIYVKDYVILHSASLNKVLLVSEGNIAGNSFSVVGNLISLGGSVSLLSGSIFNLAYSGKQYLLWDDLNEIMNVVYPDGFRLPQLEGLTELKKGYCKSESDCDNLLNE